MTLSIDLKLYNIIREAVHKDWDPIGVYLYSEEMGEYDGYLLDIYRLIDGGGTEEEIFRFLWAVETNSMGLSGDEKATRSFSKWLSGLKK